MNAPGPNCSKCGEPVPDRGWPVTTRARGPVFCSVQCANAWGRKTRPDATADDKVPRAAQGNA